MQVALIREHGDPSVIQIEQKPVPEPGPGEVLVRVLAVSINHLDLWVRRGMPGMPIPFPRILGCDGTGEIAAFGEGTEEATDLKVGDTVVIEPGYSSGTSDMDLAGLDHLSDDYGVRGEHCDGLDAEFVAIEARFLTALPDGIDPIQAAAMPLLRRTPLRCATRGAEEQHSITAAPRGRRQQQHKRGRTLFDLT